MFKANSHVLLYLKVTLWKVEIKKAGAIYLTNSHAINPAGAINPTNLIEYNRLVVLEGEEKD